MKIFIISVMLFLAGVFVAYALNPTWIEENAIWNRVFDSTNNTINVVGQ